MASHLCKFINTFIQSIKDTENELADGAGGYENIKVVRKFSPPDQELLQYVHDGIIPGNRFQSMANT